MNKPTAIVLGGTVPHKFLIENLKNRGYFTILIDYLEDPPAAKVANEHIRKSALDVAEVKRIALERNASLVISVCLDKTIPVVAEVSAALSLPSIYNPENAMLFTNKVVMKKAFVNHDIPCVPGLIAKNVEEVKAADLKFPIVLKPADATGSLGITILQDDKSIQQAFELAAKVSDSGKVIVEQFLPGREFSIDCIIKNGACNVLLIRERLKKMTPEGNIQCYSTITSVELNEIELHNIYSVAGRIPKAFALQNAPLLIQGIIDSMGVFRVIEIGVRLGGGPSAFRVVKLKTGFDFLDAAVRCNLQEDFQVKYKKSKEVFTTISLYAKVGELSNIKGIKPLLEKNIIQDFFLYKRIGTVFDNVITAKNRVGAVIVSAPNYEEIVWKVDQLYSLLHITDSDGNDILDYSLKFNTKVKIDYG